MYLQRAVVFVLASAILLASCGQTQAPTADTAAAEAAKAAQAAVAAADEAALRKQEADAASAAAARAAELALQQSELKAKEAELAAREAKLKTGTARSAAPRPVGRPPAATPAVNTKPAPRVVTVPGGSELRVALASDVSTKSAKVGDAFRARLINDVQAEGHVAVPAGTNVVGQVTKVVSGSDNIGAVPSISLHFSSLEFSGGKSLPISADYTSTGKSEKGQDTAKIIGGAAAGAVLGHQTNDKSSGTIIGGLIGAGAGTLAAKKTGSEVKLPAGTEVGVVLGSPLSVQIN